jgi:hypothetical protein
MNKLFHKVLKFANQLAGDYYSGHDKGKSGNRGKRDSNVVDIKSRGKKERDTNQGLTDFSGGAGI